MNTQILLEETQTESKNQITKEIITDESMIVGGVLSGVEIVSEEGIEYTRRSNFLG